MYQFDAIVVGAGPAGSSAALSLARAGLQVALIERGEYPGAKNVSGAALYAPNLLTDLLPNYWEEAPVERYLTRRIVTFLGQDSSGIVGPALAEKLDLPQITGVMQLDVLNEQDTVKLQVTRRLERGYREVLEAELPLLITVTSDLNEPRYPSLPAHLAALQAKIPVLDPRTLLDEPWQEESEEITILEMHVPRPRPHRIAAPDSHHRPFERISEILAGGATSRKTRLVEGFPEELARVLVQFLRDRGFL